MAEEKSQDPAAEALLTALQARFVEGLELSRSGDIDGAADRFREVLRQEPRLAEPRLELGRILAETGQLDEAEEQVAEALRILEGGGQWTEDLPEAVVMSIGWNLLGEILRQQADQDEVIFGDAAIWKELMRRSAEAFQKAATLDPENEHADHWGHHLAEGEDDGDQVGDVFPVIPEA
jgi:tetratricopeptide (TPR) repeat protein